MDFVQKKPGTTTDLQDPDALVSTEQNTQNLLRDANGNQEHNSQISINDVGPTNCRHERSNPQSATKLVETLLTEDTSKDTFIIFKEK